ncbi:hypothetical protein D3C80_802500 [compost metagenome]
MAISARRDIGYSGQPLIILNYINSPLGWALSALGQDRHIRVSAGVPAWREDVG